MELLYLSLLVPSVLPYSTPDAAVDFADKSAWSYRKMPVRINPVHRAERSSRYQRAFVRAERTIHSWMEHAKGSADTSASAM
jgi:hypothetical protein